jgi:hypothetical protein
MQPRQQEQQEAEVQQQPSLKLHNPQQQSFKKKKAFKESTLYIRIFETVITFPVLFVINYT